MNEFNRVRIEAMKINAPLHTHAASTHRQTPTVDFPVEQMGDRTIEMYGK